MQVEPVVAPVTVEYLPAAQSVSVHAAVPVSALYFPATHAVHVPPVKPAGQGATQSARASLPAGELVPIGQLRHCVAAVLPVVVTYLPAAQSVHVVFLASL